MSVPSLEEVVATNVCDKDIQLKLRTAYSVAKESTDRSTQTGAVLVQGGWNICTGYNHHVYGFGHKEEHHQRPLKYSLTEHAERHVIFKAARNGIKTANLTLVAPWVCCPDCARAIVEAGIVCVICHKQCMDRTPERWRELVDLGLDILGRGRVELIQWDGVVGECENLMNEEIWLP